jgi:hypothetical protein
MSQFTMNDRLKSLEIPNKNNHPAGPHNPRDDSCSIHLKNYFLS